MFCLLSVVVVAINNAQALYRFRYSRANCGRKIISCGFQLVAICNQLDLGVISVGCNLPPTETRLITIIENCT